MEKLKQIPISVYLLLALAVIFFWSKIVSLFKPESYQSEISIPESKLNTLFIQRGWMDNKGYFKTAQGIVTKYGYQEATSHAMQLADLMHTSKRDSWYEGLIGLTFGPTVTKIKSICNPNYPSSYRRYVINAYHDIYTENRNLESDVRSRLTQLLGGTNWTNDLTKYFKL